MYSAVSIRQWKSVSMDGAKNGIPQGYYEAAAFLVTPKQQQVISISSEYQLNEINTTFQQNWHQPNTTSIHFRKKTNPMT